MSSSLEPVLRSGIRSPLPGQSRYELLTKIASGGMGSVYVGRLKGAAGFSRIVAIKRAHEHILEDPDFAKALIAEARLASQIHHPNVVSVLDVEEIDGEIILVMDYVEGLAASDLIRSSEALPVPIVLRIALDACAGLEAIHDAKDERGRRLELVHRDVSPQNLLVGTDGLAKIADLGIAKSFGAAQRIGATTETGTIKGKLGYVAPEYLVDGAIDRRADLFGIGVVIWEMLTRRRLFRGATEAETIRLTLTCDVPKPSTLNDQLDPLLDAPILAALARSRDARPLSMRAFAESLGQAAAAAGIATGDRVGELVRRVASATLQERRRALEARAEADDADDEGLRDALLRRSAHTRAFSENEAKAVEADSRTITMVDRAEGGANVGAVDGDSEVAAARVVADGPTADSPGAAGPPRALWIGGVVIALLAVVGVVVVIARSPFGSTPLDALPPSTSVAPSVFAPAVATGARAPTIPESSAAAAGLASAQGGPDAAVLAAPVTPSASGSHRVAPPRSSAAPMPATPTKAPPNPY